MHATRARYAGWTTRRWESPGVGTPVVLLHGFTDSGHSWSGVLGALARSGRSAVAVDLPGFGSADVLAPGPILPQLDRFVADLVSVEGRGGPVVLVGNSLGALAALRAAAAGAPLDGVVLLSEPSCGDRALIRLFRRRRLGPLALLGLPVPLPRPIVHRLLVAGAARAVGRGPLDPDAPSRIADFVIGRGGPAWALRTARQLALESIDCHDFDAVTCPVLVAHGARDMIIPVNSAELIHARIPHSVLDVRRRWGHCPQIEFPDEVAAAVLGFVDGVARRTA
ncbi:alpha/beta fold hydrolase [Nocardioides sp. LML1-1-1.1]|uniref:alpha/beta fold hydrolase n=1 Tax=Nocardioides sp. LML1-1-1.1 TaxID=3135248 RepID=UPI003442B3DB